MEDVQRAQVMHFLLSVPLRGWAAAHQWSARGGQALSHCLPVLIVGHAGHNSSGTGDPHCPIWCWGKESNIDHLSCYNHCLCWQHKLYPSPPDSHSWPWEAPWHHPTQQDPRALLTIAFSPFAIRPSLFQEWFLLLYQEFSVEEFPSWKRKGREKSPQLASILFLSFFTFFLCFSWGRRRFLVSFLRQVFAFLNQVVLH